MPGFGLSLGFSMFYLCLIVLIPLSVTFLKSSTLGWSSFWHIVTTARAVESYEVSFGLFATPRRQPRFRHPHRVGAGALLVSR